MSQPLEIITSSLQLKLPWRERVAAFVPEVAKLEQVPCPLKHYFAPNIYVREIFMPAGAVVIGKIHKTEHLNFIETGSVSLVSEDGSVETFHAPHAFVSKAGVQKVLYIHEDCTWRTVHATQKRTMEELEEEIIESNPAYFMPDRSQERLDIEKAARLERGEPLLEVLP